MTAPSAVRLGTRDDPLALWRTAHVRAILLDAGTAVRLVPIERAENDPDDALVEALAGGHIDLAVHALEELPVTLPPGVELGAVSGREDPRDGLIGHEPVDWLELPFAATVAATGLRRRGQLLAARPDLHVVDVRGPLPERLARLDATPEWTALVATLANLLRLGLADRVSDRLDAMLVVPAAGQGALGVSIRAGDTGLQRRLHDGIHDPAAATAVTAERAVACALGGPPGAPVAAYAARDDATGRLRLHARVVAPDGSAVVEAVRLAGIADGDECGAEAFGQDVAAELVARGAAALLGP